MLHVFVGYDPREDEAFRVCKHSLERHSSEPVMVTPLKKASLEKSGLYWRKSKLIEGQMWDIGDGKPFSTEFSFTRFLVPEIARLNQLKGWAMFVDCDFLFKDDVALLFDSAENQDADVCVVKHNYTPFKKRKMDDQIQEPYSKKLWSSLMLINLQSEAALNLTPDYVNAAKGSALHQFEWVEEARLGALGEGWNWIPGVSPTTQYVVPKISAIHYTEGGPWFKEYADVAFAEDYQKELKLVEAAKFSWKDVVRL